LLRWVVSLIMNLFRVVLATVCCWETSHKAHKDIRTHGKNTRRLSAKDA
jgi:hypothetical protein